MDRVAKIKAFFKYGWTLFTTVEEALSKISDRDLALIQKLYAAFHGLSSASDVAAHLEAPRYCNLPDTMEVRNSVCRWPDVNVTWDVQAVPPGLQKQQVVECITEAFRRWAAVSGLVPTYSPGNPSARIVVGTRSIDGQFGVLAESELPCGNVTQCRQWYDSGESWKFFDGPGQPNDIDMVRVATHELGHALGMNHIGAGNLLAPTYSPSISTPQAGDIAEMQARYGKPNTSPPVVPPAHGGSDYTLHFTGGVLSIDGYRLTKLAGAA